MQNANHRTRHAYRLSYSLEVGSSFDPDLEDVDAWESELRGTSLFALHCIYIELTPIS